MFGRKKKALSKKREVELKSNELLGKIVLSISGRDSGKYFVITYVCDNEYVMICDGKFRTTDAPKRKKIKHLRLTQQSCDEQYIANDEVIASDSQLQELIAKKKEAALSDEK